MEIITQKNAEGIEEQLIMVEIVDPYTKKKLIFKFKEFTIDEFKKVRIMMPTDAEEGTAAQSMNPTIFMINSMMVEGNKLTGKEHMVILNKLKKELADFL
jgi:hypothetical protein